MKQGSQHNKPQLSHFGFWNVYQSKLDYHKYASFVIIRTMERGNEQDIKEVIRYYGKKAVIRELTLANSLMPRAGEAGKQLFNLKESDFKCFTATTLKRKLSQF